MPAWIPLALPLLLTGLNLWLTLRLRVNVLESERRILEAIEEKYTPRREMDLEVGELRRRLDTLEARRVA